MKLVLASGSPRRAEILRNAGIPFEIVRAAVSEDRLPGEPPEEYVRRVAEVKAWAAAACYAAKEGEGAAWIVGADTAVVVGGEILGKPASAAHARYMLRRLSGKRHEVVTALAVLLWPVRKLRVHQETTRVLFAALTDQEIEAYVASGEPFDKAGAYAIQGRAGRFVLRVEGDFLNVMGLPLDRLKELLSEMGWKSSEKAGGTSADGTLA